MPALKNIRHEKFCQALFRGEPAVRAYESAGYKVHQSSSSRLRWFAMVQSRVAELQAEAAKSSELTVESLLAELEELRAKAVSREQYAAGVRAVSEKIKLSGLAMPQRIELSEAQFSDDSSPEAIVAAVAREKGNRAAWYLCMAFGLSPDKYGIVIDGEVIADSRVIGGNGEETRGVRATRQTFSQPQIGHSQYQAEQAKPRRNGR